MDIKKGFKVVVLLIAGLIFSSNSAFAQKSGFGIRGGFNYNQFQDSEGLYGGDLYGYHMGVFGIIGFSRSFALQPELLYSREGSVNRSPGTATDPVTDMPLENYERRVEYLDLPVFLRINVTRGLHFLAGPQASYLLRSRHQFASPEGATGVTSGDVENRLEYAAVVGLGYEFFSGFSLGVRYGRGFGDFGGSNNNPESFVNPAREHFGQVTFGWTFGGRRTGC
ncbi:porin family protein [Cytophagaceae bacterium ABcell3]|nr:porin family protein [Cytophagaceae bacterium ABcell3]